MKALLLRHPAPIEGRPLALADLHEPAPGPGDVLIQVTACGLCRTDLHIVEGELPAPRLPIVLGHQVVGRIVALGSGVSGWRVGDRAGLTWLYSACGRCDYCRAGRENLCREARFTGYHADGGYAEQVVAPAEFALPLPDTFSDLHAAPLLCAGVIGYRALKQAGVRPGQRLGLYGFGSSAHIVLQVARHQGTEVYVFTRGEEHRVLARSLGAAWAGPAEEPPVRLHAAILFAPAGGLVPVSLEALEPGGTLVLAGIAMSPVPELDYRRHLYEEKRVLSVANTTRQDARDFLRLAAEVPVRTEVQAYPLEQANEALLLLKEGRISGSGVLQVG